MSLVLRFLAGIALNTLYTISGMEEKTIIAKKQGFFLTIEDSLVLFPFCGKKTSNALNPYRFSISSVPEGVHMQKKYYLLAPGPTPVPPKVLAAMSEPRLFFRS